MTAGWKTRDRIRTAVADAVMASVDRAQVRRVCALLLDPDPTAQEPALRAFGPLDCILWATCPLPPAGDLLERLADWWEELRGERDLVSINLRLQAAHLGREDWDAKERAQAERVRLAEKALRTAQAELWRAENGIE